MSFFGLLLILSFLLLPFLWVIREVRAINFWLYLWQLKEYHAGRLIDHFRTFKGRSTLFNISNIVKILLLLLWLWLIPSFSFDGRLASQGYDTVVNSFTISITILYALETLKYIRDGIQKRVLKPITTFKINILRPPLLLLVIFSAFYFSILSLDRSTMGSFISSFLIFDLLTPIFVSAVVLVFQPFAVLGRNRILAQARAKRAGMRHLKVVGITGSYGKTTTKEILAHVLAAKFKVAKTQKHQNSEIGVSRAILDNLKPEHEVFVCEMGAYNKGGIRLLAGIAQPQIAVLTGANEQHLATFGSMENLLSAEGGKELVEALPADEVAIFNGANIHTRKLYKETTKKKILVGLGGAVFAEEVKAEQEKIVFRIAAQVSRPQERASLAQQDWVGGEALVTAPLLGAHNTENILLAAAVALELGMTLEEIAQVLKTLPQGVGAMTLKRGKGGLHIIDSSYSANPSGVLADLEYLKVWPGKKVIVMPSLIELGKASKEVHEKIGRKIAEVCDLAVITTQDHVADIQRGAGDKKKNILYIPDWKKIVDTIQSFCQAEDVVLLGGRVPPQIMQNLAL